MADAGDVQVESKKPSATNVTRDELKIVADQHGCSTRAGDIAKTCLEIAKSCALIRVKARYGIYHCAGAGETTWFELRQRSLIWLVNASQDGSKSCPTRNSSSRYETSLRLGCTEFQYCATAVATGADGYDRSVAD